MSRFKAGVFDGNSVRATPKDWRRYIPLYNLWSPPYTAGTQLFFDLELTDPQTAVRLFNLPFYVFYIASKNERRIQFDSSKQEKKRTIDSFVLPGEGILQVWAGKPEGEGSLLLITADVVNPTTIYIAIITAVFTGTCGGIIGLIFARLACGSK
jgi:hypothetical protein